MNTQTHEQNERCFWSLRGRSTLSQNATRSVLLLILASMILGGCGSSRNSGVSTESSSGIIDDGGGASPDPSCAGMSDLECQMFDSINGIREANGVARLVVLSNCVAAAGSHAEDMATSGYFSHDGLNETWSQRMARFGLSGSAVGENIAYGGNVATIANNWMNSSGHRANILNGAYRSTGIGHAVAANGRPYWVQCFSAKAGD